MSESLSMKWNRRFRGLTMYVFNFARAKCQAGSVRNFRFPWQLPSLNSTFSTPTTKKHRFSQCFRCLSCFSAAVANADQFLDKLMRQLCKM